MTATTPEWPDWVREQLDRRGWLKQDLARKLGYDPAHMSRITTGRRRPTRDACVHIAQLFNTTPDTVLRLAGWPPTDEPPPVTTSDAIDADPRLTRAQKDILLATYRSWVPE